MIVRGFIAASSMTTACSNNLLCHPFHFDQNVTNSSKSSSDKLLESTLLDPVKAFQLDVACLNNPLTFSWSSPFCRRILALRYVVRALSGLYTSRSVFQTSKARSA